MKKLYFLDEQEKNRILNLHTEATKKQYLSEKKLLNEAAPPKRALDFLMKIFSGSKKFTKPKSVKNPAIWDAMDETIQKISRAEDLTNPKNIKQFIRTKGDDVWMVGDDNTTIDFDTIKKLFDGFENKPNPNSNELDIFLSRFPDKIKSSDNKTTIDFRKTLRDNYNKHYIDLKAEGGLSFNPLKNFFKFKPEGNPPSFEPIRKFFNLLKTISSYAAVGGGTVFLLGKAIQGISRTWNLNDQIGELDKSITKLCNDQGFVNGNPSLTETELQKIADNIYNETVSNNLISYAYSFYAPNFDKDKFKELINQIDVDKKGPINFCKVWQKFNNSYGAYVKGDLKNWYAKPLITFLKNPFDGMVTDAPKLFNDYVVKPIKEVMSDEYLEVSLESLPAKIKERLRVKTREQDIVDMIAQRADWAEDKNICVVNSYKNNRKESTIVYTKQTKKKEKTEFEEENYNPNSKEKIIGDNFFKYFDSNMELDIIQIEYDNGVVHRYQPIQDNTPNSMVTIDTPNQSSIHKRWYCKENEIKIV
jgi:hypothetical protein